jgi:hypothetical protein
MFMFQGARDIMYVVLMEKIKSPKEKSFVGTKPFKLFYQTNLR